ncbi:MAG: type II secretion system protein, partial [Alphaproteobacteria bacterium]
MAGPTTPSWRAPAPQPPQAGFTLLELMVSLALVGLLTMVLTGGIRFGARVWEASQVQAEAANEVHS